MYGTTERGPVAKSVTRTDLGASYLVLSAVCLLAGLVAYLAFTFESPVVLAVGTTSGGAGFLTIGYVGLAAWRTDGADEFVWSIAQYFALGLSLATLVALELGLTGGGLEQRTLLELLIVVVVTGGGIVGALVGSVVSLRRRHVELRTLHQQHSVMNRVLRHNIRNDVNVIQGHAEMLAEELDREETHTDVIVRKAREIVSLSSTARDVEVLDGDGQPGPVNLARMAREFAATATSKYPTASVTYEGPDVAWVGTSSLVRSVLANLVDNAVRYHDGEPSIRLSVDERVDSVELRVADDGPGIPAEQFAILFEESEDRHDHGSGMGLWLVKWLADRHDGELHLEDNEPRGSVVCLTLPAADPPEN
ncbi:sensor histidine kinase [Halobacteriales archaeon Cl-PHB]